MRIRGNKQQGAVLVLTVIFLFIMLGSSLHFFRQIMDDIKISGASRDSNESLLLAESAMELLRGRFINNLDTNPTINVTSCNVGGISLDKCEASEIGKNINDPSAYLMPYMYYVSSATALDQTKPSILQNIANGEATNKTPSTMGAQKISLATKKLRINDLFGAGFNPRLFAVNSNGLLEDSLVADWDTETSLQKAAAWIEVILNPTNSSAVDLYVQAVAQAGNGRSYLQRYVGTYFVSDTIGALVSPLAESSGINRDIP